MTDFQRTLDEMIEAVEQMKANPPTVIEDEQDCEVSMYFTDDALKRALCAALCSKGYKARCEPLWLIVKAILPLDTQPVQ